MVSHGYASGTRSLCYDRALASIRIRIVDQASSPVAALIIAVGVEVWIALLVELQSRVDRLVGIIDHASNAMTAIVAAIIAKIACRVVVALCTVRKPLNDGAEDGSGHDVADVVTLLVIHAGILVEPVTAAIVIAADIGEDAGTPLCDPDIPALRIIPPSAIDDA